MKKLAIVLSTLLFISSSYAQSLTEVIKLVASDRSVEDWFGYAVSVSGNYAIVGARYEDHDTLGGDLLGNAGSVYIFERDGSGEWHETQKLVASDRDVVDEFGYSVSVFGNYAIVGAFHEDHDTAGANLLSNAGSAYIFERDGSGQWNETQKLVSSDRQTDDWFGFSVSISGDYAVVGAYNEDHDTNGTMTMIRAGSAYIFERDGSGQWNEEQKLVASDRKGDDYFGYAVSISGDYVLIGAYGEDHDTTGGNFLSSAGSAYIFERNGIGEWHEAQKLVTSDREEDDYFGSAVSISGDYAVVDAHREGHDTTGGDFRDEAGSVYVFQRNGIGQWHEAQKLVASDREGNDYFGYSVSISDDHIVVGAYNESHDTLGSSFLTRSGSAYIFERDGSDQWHETQKLVAPDREASDRFGYAVSISGEYVFVGAYNEDQDTAGSSFMSNAGSAYLFEFESAGCLTTMSAVSVMACDSYTVPSGDETYTSSTVVSDTVPNAGGCDSILTITLTITNSNTGDTTAVECDSYTWHGVTYTSSASPTHIYTNAAGCDSVVMLDLTIPTPDTAVSQSGMTLMSSATGVDYQWLDCSDNSPIIGETNVSYTPIANGSFAVEVTDNGCNDTSSCYPIIIIGIAESDLVSAIRIFPNPTKGGFTVDFGRIDQNATVSVSDMAGKMIREIEFMEVRLLEVPFDAVPGVYFVAVSSENGRAVFKVVKE